MIKFSRLLFVVIFFIQRTALPSEAGGIQWQDWKPELFQQAQKENKLLILDLEAVWCHWCHVMAQKTYANKKVSDIISQKFIAIKVDQDLRPDISKRYEDYGWPATIFFDAKGTELAKRSGFFPPEEMIPLLQKLVKDPTPEETSENKTIKIPDSPFLTAELKKTLMRDHLGQYESKYGGWGEIHKFLFGDSEELAMRLAWRGDSVSTKQAKETLTKAIQIIDPVWGGAYQYSVKTWKEPHFEKIAEAQQKNLFLYSLGYSLFEDPQYLKAAKDIYRFLNDFFRDPNGAYYTSQDADLVKGVHSEGYFKLNDAARRKKGMPILDKHQYARENGWYISGMCALYAATGDNGVLSKAITAAQWVEQNRKLAPLNMGGYRHDERDLAGPYLGDTLEMGFAYLKLYEVTGDRAHLKKSEEALNYIGEHFGYKIDNKTAGFVGSLTPIAKGINPEPDRQENIHLARFANLLFHYTANKKYKEWAEQAMKYVTIPSLASQQPTAGVILADRELTESPVHLTIVGAKKDADALALFQAALKYPTSYKRVEWWDKSEGAMPNPDVQYPSLPKAAAFACNGGRCSLPFTDPKVLRQKIDKLYQ